MKIRKVFATAATALIVVAAVAVVSWFVFSALTGARLLIFRTGSMSPTIPQGSIAVSVPVTAEEIIVGDVITVQRPDADLPVTHRVTEIRTPEEATTEGLPPEARELIMQGDGNDTPDARPYTITTARRVIFSVPRAGNALMMAQSPLGMGSMILLAGALTVWAFWPTKRPDPSPLPTSASPHSPPHASPTH